MNGLVFGIDLGIASCGWAVLRHPSPEDPTGKIVAMGSWMFDVPETDKERTPTNQIRRGNRLLRRVIRRRAQRMAEIRRLFVQHGLLAVQEPDALKRVGLNPWELRARGLDKLLSPAEFAVGLGRIAKRRGFKSARKGKEANTAGDDQKMLKALEATRERLGRYRTVGEMFGRDADFRDRKRNRDGLFDRAQSRDDLIHEVGKLFEAHAAWAMMRLQPPLKLTSPPSPFVSWRCRTVKSWSACASSSQRKSAPPDLPRLSKGSACSASW